MHCNIGLGNIGRRRKLHKPDLIVQDLCYGALVHLQKIDLPSLHLPWKDRSEDQVDT